MHIVREHWDLLWAVLSVLSLSQKIIYFDIIIYNDI